MKVLAASAFKKSVGMRRTPDVETAEKGREGTRDGRDEGRS